MIILALRTDKPEAEVGLYEDTKQLAHETWEAHRQLAETLHKKINNMLERLSKDWPDIGGIVVFAGPGSFTGLRIGISVANALGYSNGVPIVGTRGEDWLTSGLDAIAAGKNDKIVQPFYGSDAHITTPKK